MATKGETTIVLGTRKGVFTARSRDRRRWKVDGPFFEGIECYHAIVDPRDGRTIWAAPSNRHWGHSIRVSKDGGAKWAKPLAGPKYPESSGLSVERIWHLAPGEDGYLYVGVEPAGLFRSADGGKSWEGV